MKKTIYEAPSTKILQVRVQGRILDGSINATRQGYGPAEVDTWGDE